MHVISKVPINAQTITEEAAVIADNTEVFMQVSAESLSPIKLLKFREKSKLNLSMESYLTVDHL